MSRLAIVLLLVASGTSYARDSAWLVCRGIAEHGTGADKEKVHLVASMLEHRNGTGDGRDLDVTVIYGAHVHQAVVLGGKGGDVIGKAMPVKLKSVEGKRPLWFTGKVQIASDMSTVTFTGSADWAFGADPKAKPEPISGTLVCEELDDMAIGH